MQSMAVINLCRSISSSHGAVLAAVASLLAVAVGCSDVEPGGPRPTLVEPDEGPNDRKIAIAILGTFHPLLRANYDDEAQAGVSTEFTARLNDVPLLDLHFVAPTKLSAVVPAGLEPKIYNLVIGDPRGKTGVLHRAYTVKPATPGLDAGPDLLGPDAAHLDGGLDLVLDGVSLDLPSDLAVPDQQPPDSKPGPTVTTLAGTGVKGFADGPATSTARFFNPMGLAVHGPALYVADYGNHRVRKIASGQVETAAGSGQQGYLDGAGTSAEFNFPAGVAVDGASGKIVVADTSNDVIRQVIGGTVSTLAGSGAKGFLDGPVASARFNYPRGIAVEAGKVYVADTQNHRIRVIAGGSVSTLAGSGVNGFLDGPVANARFSQPTGIDVVGGVVYVADSGNNRIRKIASGAVTTVAGKGSSGNTDGSASVAEFSNPVDLVAAAARVYVVDQGNHRIRVIEAGVVSTVAGSYQGFKDGPIKGALFKYPHGIALGSSGQLYVGDQSNHRVRVITF
jgi:hypothetical protein